MESLMIVGADKLGSIPDKLEELGFRHIEHLSGRKVRMIHKGIPESIDLVLVLTDFINHNTAKKVTERAKMRSIPICYAKRYWCSIYQSLTHCPKVCHDCSICI
ncbi:hypothetical protein SAMN05192534_103134 [Alteribacillus persepolensis]|uniref:Dihydroorotate dehydrogenase n=1 Tax=Alteribacillus persepolensis TaxID=568899 RepID=A0A1G8B3I6_9BACI|nr:DUF2325 domain-containing protein [Alteribacillus persepolensis]SDH27746.1 hypothetical protein SAMN05192534_103134 [Alteribacillus persepolensis]